MHGPILPVNSLVMVHVCMGVSMTAVQWQLKDSSAKRGGRHRRQADRAANRGQRGRTHHSISTPQH